MIRSLIILCGLLAIALACAPHMPKRNLRHGYCKFYIDGTSDFDSARKKRDSSSSSGSHGSHEHGHSHEHTKKKETKCYEYEDGSQDDGATLNEGVTYVFIVTKDSKDKEKHGFCKFYVDGTSDTGSSRAKRESKSGSKKFNRLKKKKDTKCYEYEDGAKDEGAVLNKGVKYVVIVTKESEGAPEHGYCLFYIDGTSDLLSGRKKRSPSGSNKFNRSKKKKTTKCYEYEDGGKDEGAVLNKGIKYTITITQTNI